MYRRFIILILILIPIVLLLIPIAVSELVDELEHLGRYAAATYERFEDWTDPNQCTVCQHPDIRATTLNTTWAGLLTRGFIGINQPNVIVAFRGTTHIMDVLTNSHAVQTRWPPSVNGSMVHEGFLAAYLDAHIMDHLSLIMADPQFRGYQVHFVGHSLGAAQATLAYAEWMLGGGDAVLTTFGSPRVGNLEFAQLVNTREFWRVVNRADIVPHLPMKLMAYVSAGREVWVGDDVVECESPGEECNEDPRCSASVSPFLWNLVDHMVYPGIRLGIPKYFEQ